MLSKQRLGSTVEELEGASREGRIVMSEEVGQEREIKEKK